METDVFSIPPAASLQFSLLCFYKVAVAAGLTFLQLLLTIDCLRSTRIVWAWKHRADVMGLVMCVCVLNLQGT